MILEPDYVKIRILLINSHKRGVFLYDNALCVWIHTFIPIVIRKFYVCFWKEPLWGSGKVPRLLHKEMPFTLFRVILNDDKSPFPIQSNYCYIWEGWRSQIFLIDTTKTKTFSVLVLSYLFYFYHGSFWESFESFSWSRDMSSQTFVWTFVCQHRASLPLGTLYSWRRTVIHVDLHKLMHFRKGVSFCHFMALLKMYHVSHLWFLMLWVEARKTGKESLYKEESEYANRGTRESRGVWSEA